MAFLQTEHLGLIEYDPAEVIRFPHGLPAFETEREFLALLAPGSAPVVFLQSIASPELTFLTVPPAHVDPEYRVELHEECDFLQGPLTVLLIVSAGVNQPPTVNLLAPVVIDTRSRMAMQVVMTHTGYSAQHPLQPQSGQEAAACW
jgi:flagellar assembly factor FliW